MMNARVTVAVAAVLLGAAAAGCSSAGGTAATTGDVSAMPVVTGLETHSLVVEDFPAVESAGLYIAKVDGLFAKEGLTVDIELDEHSSQDAVDQIKSGKAQVSSGDYVTYMNDLTGTTDSDLEIIGEGSVLQPHVLSLMVSGTTDVKSLKQLENKAIPISGKNDIGSLLIDSVLADNNVPISSVHYVPGIPLPAVPTLIHKGQFVAGPVPEPFVSEGEQQFGDTVLADLDQGGTTNFPVQGYAVTRQWAEQNPNTLKAFVTALDEGQEIADTNRVELQTAIEGELHVPVNVASVISIPEFPIGVDPTRLERVVADMIEFKFFKGNPAGLARAKALATTMQSHVYLANIATGNGASGLLGG